MATWIARYRAGEHVEVWNELQAPGAKLGKPAQDVARETMQRARQNVLRLFQLLPQLGYKFRGADETSPPDYPLELRLDSALEHIRGSRHRGDPWSHRALAWIEEEEIDLPAHHRKGKPGRANYRPPGPRTSGILDCIEASLGGPLPMAVRGWFETVGSVDLAGTHPILNRNGEVETLRIVLDPGGAGLSASASAGAEFVASLRHAFAWGGFSGWAGKPGAPEREIAWLRSKMVEL